MGYQVSCHVVSWSYKNIAINIPQAMPDEMCKPKAMGLNVNNKIMWENGDSGIFYMFIKTLNPACMVWNTGNVQVSCALWSGLHKVFSHLKWDSKSQRACLLSPMGILFISPECRSYQMYTEKMDTIHSNVR